MAEQPSEDISERGDSGITTCFTFREQGQQSVQTESNEYANWPIEVQVLSPEKLESTKAARSSAPRQRTLLLNLKRQIKPALAAAAVILIGVAFFFGTSAARAVDLDRIYKAVKIAPNIRITRFKAGETEPERERSGTDYRRALREITADPVAAHRGGARGEARDEAFYCGLMISRR